MRNWTVTTNCIEYDDIYGTSAFNESEPLPLIAWNVMIYSELTPSMNLIITISIEYNELRWINACN